MHNLQTIANGVRERQQVALNKKALAGNTRAIELRWQHEVNDAHRFMPPTFTDKERGFVSDLIERLGTEETIKLIVWSAKTWKSHLSCVSLYGIPPLPTFDFFYFRRNIFLALMKEREQRQEKFQKDHEEIAQKVKQQEQERPKISLVDLFLQAKVEVRKEKEREAITRAQEEQVGEKPKISLMDLFLKAKEQIAEEKKVRDGG